MTAGPPADPQAKRPTRAARAAWWARRQPALLALLAAGCLAVAAAVLVAAAGGDVRALDRAALRALRHADAPGRGVGPAWIAEAAAEFTALGGKAVIPTVVLLAAGLLALTRRPGLAAGLIASTAGAAVFAFLLKDWADRPRPPAAWRLQDVHTTSAFPSVHAALATVVYVTLGTLAAEATPRRAVRAYLVSAGVLVAAGVGLTRVYLGVHWLTDVAAGWAVGAAWAYGLRAATRAARARRFARQDGAGA